MAMTRRFIARSANACVGYFRNSCRGQDSSWSQIRDYSCLFIIYCLLTMARMEMSARGKQIRPVLVLFEGKPAQEGRPLRQIHLWHLRCSQKGRQPSPNPPPKKNRPLCGSNIRTTPDMKPRVSLRAIKTVKPRTSSTDPQFAVFLQGNPKTGTLEKDTHMGALCF